MSLPDYINRKGTRAAQPAATAVSAGVVYCVDDEGDKLERSTGAVWEAWSPVGSGDVTASGTLTASRLILGAGTTLVSAAASLGTTTTVLHGNAAGAPTFAAVSLTADVSGVVPVANGGTNLASYTVGDTLYASGATTLTKLAIGTAGQVLTVNGGATAPAWAAASGGTSFGFTAPVNGDFAWVNQGTASVTAGSVWGGTSIFLVGQAAGSSILRVRVKTAPATPYTVATAYAPIVYNDAEQEAGICFRESGTGELKIFGFQQDGDYVIVRHMTSPTVRGTAHRFYTNARFNGPVVWMRLGDDGTNRTYEYSPDGVNWVTFYSELRTADMTADQIGFYVGGGNTVAPCLTLFSWLQA